MKTHPKRGIPEASSLSIIQSEASESQVLIVSNHHPHLTASNYSAINQDRNLTMDHQNNKDPNLGNHSEDGSRKNSETHRLKSQSTSPVRDATMVVSSSMVGLSSKRFFILTLFCLFSASSGFQWIEYSIISSVLQDYYHVSSYAINWTSASEYIMSLIVLPNTVTI